MSDTRHSTSTTPRTDSLERSMPYYFKTSAPTQAMIRHSRSLEKQLHDLVEECKSRGYEVKVE